jgi:hypothetical protein
VLLLLRRTFQLCVFSLRELTVLWRLLHPQRAKKHRRRGAKPNVPVRVNKPLPRLQQPQRF